MKIPYDVQTDFQTSQYVRGPILVCRRRRSIVHREIHSTSEMAQGNLVLKYTVFPNELTLQIGIHSINNREVKKDVNINKSIFTSRTENSFIFPNPHLPVHPYPAIHPSPWLNIHRSSNNSWRGNPF